MVEYKSNGMLMNKYCSHVIYAHERLKENPRANVDSFCYVGFRQLKKFHGMKEAVKTRQLNKIVKRANVLLRVFKDRPVHKEISCMLNDLKEEVINRAGR